MGVLPLRIAALASFIDVVWLSTELQRQLFRSGYVVMKGLTRLRRTVGAERIAELLQDDAKILVLT